MNQIPVSLKAFSASQLLPARTVQQNLCLGTGVPELDRLLQGGLPLGAITELTGSASSGKTSLLFRLLARATSEQQIVSYIDTFDSFDPLFARTSGIRLTRLLWIRAGKDTLSERIRKSLKTVDVLARSRDFSVIVWDLATESTGKAAIQRIPFHCWFRLKKVLSGKQTVLLLLSPVPCAGSAAAAVLGLEQHSSRWKPTIRQGVQETGLSSHMQLFRGFTTRISVLRGKNHGHIEIHCRL